MAHGTLAPTCRSRFAGFDSLLCGRLFERRFIAARWKQEAHRRPAARRERAAPATEAIPGRAAVGTGGMTTNLGGAPGSGGAGVWRDHWRRRGQRDGRPGGGDQRRRRARAGGGANCVGRAISLSSNGTGMDSDAAQAEIMIDLGTALPIGNAHRTIEFWAYIKPTDWVGDKNEIYYTGGTGTRHRLRHGLRDQHRQRHGDQSRDAGSVH